MVMSPFFMILNVYWTFDTGRTGDGGLVRLDYATLCRWDVGEETR